MQQGGYNLGKAFIKKDAEAPVLSIITVVYNSELYLERTIQSIQQQDFLNIEYLIVDGGSTDNTLSIIKTNESLIANWVSAKDNGIYDAMNKGLALATGDYVLFLNSGDELYATNTCTIAFKSHPSADAYYGDTLIVDEKGKPLSNRRLRPPSALSYKDFQMGMIVCHQSIIVKKSLAANYNTTYKISADIDWVIRSLQQAKVLVNTNTYISKFMEGGMSQVNMRQGLIERFKILQQHFGLIKNLFNHLKITFRLVGNYFSK